MKSKCGSRLGLSYNAFEKPVHATEGVQKGEPQSNHEAGQLWEITKWGEITVKGKEEKGKEDKRVEEDSTEIAVGFKAIMVGGHEKPSGNAAKKNREKDCIIEIQEQVFTITTNVMSKAVIMDFHIFLKQLVSFLKQGCTASALEQGELQDIYEKIGVTYAGGQDSGYVKRNKHTEDTEGAEKQTAIHQEDAMKKQNCIMEAMSEGKMSKE
ncbi:hypothetical protein HGM15179_008112 [Zosterops borbonicus]|uniref:Uncharacterized protein n=1 Tax=Zosterops borbonicus TaxID=364589 RepID=A0A8K1LLU4_9PASS|nr:hypothetical protein HGM15179_008112 [Zosterops borbonicus]